MARFAGSRTDMTNILKTVYPPREIFRIFSRKRVLFNLIAANPQELDEGAEFKYAVHTGRSAAGAHVMAEPAPIPDTSPQLTDWLTFNMCPYLHPIGYTGQFKHTTKTRRAAAARGISFVVENALEDARDDFATAHYTPANGMLTKCRNSTTSTGTDSVFNVENPERLRVGMYISLAKVDTAGTSTGGYDADPGVMYISDISGRQITVAGATYDGSDSDWTVDAYGVSNVGVWLVREYAGQRSGDKAGTRPYGLEDIVNDANPIGTNVSTYGGVDRTTAGNDWNKGRVLDLQGGEIDHDVADEAADLVSVLGNGEVDFWVTTPSIYRAIKKLHVGDKRAQMREKVGNGWFPVAYLADRPVYADKFCTARTIYGIDRNRIEFKETKPTGWEDDDGAMWHRMTDYWQYMALLTRMWQICAVCRCHVAIKNVRSTSFSDVGVI